MKILARGEKIRTEELKLKLSSVVCDLTVNNDLEISPAKLKDFDLIFDLNFDDHKNRLADYAELKMPVIVSSVKIQLAKTVSDFGKEINFPLIGMNCLPTFINRDLVEISLVKNSEKEIAKRIFSKLNWKYRIVEDRVGMVTPRIIFMIINEAFYTLEERTATKEDIDTSMKLGTNYPFGPFEWADKIGSKNVYETLEAIYNNTKDERYKICPLLKMKYLNGERFADQED
ncbi:MAG: 3-hydroxyacyl-CoA dehydrogenase family protein [Bacteroidia bacterium]